MSPGLEAAVTVFGSLLVSISIIGAFIYAVYKMQNKHSEDRHKQTETLLTARVTETKTEIMTGVHELKTDLHMVKDDVHAIDGKVATHDRRLNFVEQRTAAVESAVFHRPPILDDEM